MDDTLDCIVIGGGPAGLTAAIYLTRFHLRVTVADGGKSRMAMIPRTRNHSGFPGGIAGPDLLSRMQRQAESFGVQIEPCEVLSLEETAGGFAVRSADHSWLARSVVLATGVCDVRPRIAADVHDEAVARGLLRYCPICDGYEATDRRIGIIATGEKGHGEARFLRMYSADITLISPDGPHRLNEKERAELEALGVCLVDGPYSPLELDDAAISTSAMDRRWSFDTVYPALGSVINSQLAVALGAEADDQGCLVVDAHQRTTVPGLYAAGDVILGLDQISFAMGQASVAATALRNDLAEAAPLIRP